jgi:tape measure domain-containing protein
MSLSLGTLEIGLGLNTAQYDSGIKSAKDQLSSLERRVTKLGTTPLKIKVSVDDRQLYGLNSHLLLKRVDLKKTVDFYKANPIKVFAEDDALVSLNQELRELKKTSVEIGTPSKIVVEHRFSGYQDRVEKAIDRSTSRISSEIRISSSKGGVVGAIGRILMSPFKLAGRVLDDMVTGYFEKLGQSFAEEIGVTSAKNTAKKIKSAITKIDEQLIGKNQVYETFLSEFFRSGSIEKATQASFPRTEVGKTTERLQKLQEIALVPANKPLERLRLIKENSELNKIYQQVLQKIESENPGIKPREAGKKAIAQFLVDAQPQTQVLKGFVNSFIQEMAPLLKFIQGMRSYRTSVESQKYYNEKKAGFPLLKEGEDVVSVIGGAQFKGGQGGRQVVQSIELLAPNKRFIPVENPETDTDKQNPNPLEKMIRDKIAEIAPDFAAGETIDTAINAFRQVVNAINPFGYSTAAAQAIANTRLAEEQGKKGSVVSYSLGGADNLQYAQTASYLGMQPHALAMAYPFLNFTQNTPKGFNAALLSGDPLGFAKLLGIGVNTNQFHSIESDTPFGLSNHHQKHLFKKQPFLDLFYKTINAEQPDMTLGQQSKVVHAGDKLYEVLGSTLQLKSLKETGEFDKTLPYHRFLQGYSSGSPNVSVEGFIAKFFEGLRLISSFDTKELQPVSQALKSLMEPLIPFIAKKFRQGGANLPENPQDFAGYQKYQQEAKSINSALLEFKSGKLANIPSWYAGNLEPNEVKRRTEKIRTETIPWFTSEESTFGQTYTKKIVEAYKKIADVADEFIKTGGKLSQKTKDSIKTFEVDEFSGELTSFLNTRLDTSTLLKEEEVRQLQVTVPEIFLKKQSAILAYNKLLNAVGKEILPGISEIKKIGAGMSGAVALLSDNLVYKTDLDPIGATKIASEDEIKAYEKLQGRLSPLLYKAVPGQALITERTQGRPLKEILDRIARPYKEIQQKIQEANKALELAIDNKDATKIKELKVLTKELQSSAKKEHNRFNKAASILYRQVGQLGASLQEMGVVHNDLAAGNVFFAQGGITSIDLGNAKVDPTSSDKFNDKITTIQRAIIDSSYYGLMDPLKIIGAIQSGYSKPFATQVSDSNARQKSAIIPQKREINETLLSPVVTGEAIPLGSYTPTLLKQIVGDFSLPTKETVFAKIDTPEQKKEQPILDNQPQKLNDLAVAAKSKLEDVLASRLGTPDKSGEIQHLSGNEDFAELLQLTLVRELKTASLLLSKAFRDTSLDVVKFGQVVYAVMQALERPVMAIPGMGLGKKALQVGGTAAMGAAALHALPMGLDATVVNTMRDILAGAMSAGGREMIQAVATQMTQAFSGLPFGVGQQLTEAVVQLVTEITNGTISVLSQGGAVAGSALMAGEGVKKLLGAATSNVPKLISKEEQQKIEGKTQKALKAAKNKADSLITTEITPYFDERVFPASNPIPANIKAINPEYYTVKQLRGLARDQGIDVPASGAGARKEEIWKSLTEKFNPDQLTRLLLTTKASDRTKLGKKELSGFQVETTEIPADFTKRIGIGIKNIGQEINTTKDIQSLERLYFQLEKVKKGITALRANPEFNTTSINKSLSGFLQSVDNLQTQILTKGGLESGKNLNEGLEKGLKDTSASDIAYQNALKIVDQIDKGLGNASPSWKGEEAGENLIKGVAIGIEKGISSFDFRSLANEVVKGFESGLSLGDIEKIIQSYFDVNIPNLKDLAVEAKMMGWEGKPIDGLLEKKLSKFPLSKTFTPVEPPKNDIISYPTPTRLIESSLPSENALASASIRLKQLSNFYAGHKTAFANLQAILTQGIDPTFNQWSLRRDRFDFEKQVFKEPVAYSAINSFSEPIKGNDYYGDAEIMLDIAKIANRSTFTRGDSGAFWRNPSEIITNPLSSFTPDQYNRRPNEILEYLEVQTTGKIDPSDFLGINLGDIEEKYNIYGRKLIEVIASSLSAGVPVFAKNLEAISSMFSSDGKQSGLNYIKGLNIGLQNNNSEKYALDVAIGIIDATNKGLGNASPSWKGKEAGRNLIRGLEIGTKEQAKLYVQFFDKFLQDVNERLQLNQKQDAKFLIYAKREHLESILEDGYQALHPNSNKDRGLRQEVESQMRPDDISSNVNPIYGLWHQNAANKFIGDGVWKGNAFPRTQSETRLAVYNYGGFEPVALEGLFNPDKMFLHPGDSLASFRRGASEYSHYDKTGEYRGGGQGRYHETREYLKDVNIPEFFKKHKIGEPSGDIWTYGVEGQLWDDFLLTGAGAFGWSNQGGDNRRTAKPFENDVIELASQKGVELHDTILVNKPDASDFDKMFGNDKMAQERIMPGSLKQNIAEFERLYKAWESIISGKQKKDVFFELSALLLDEQSKLRTIVKSIGADMSELMLVAGKAGASNFEKGLEIGVNSDDAKRIAYQTAIEIVDATNKGLGNASPSKKAMKAMRFFYEGLALGARHIRFGLRLETQFDKEVSDFTFFVGTRSKEARKAILQAVKEMGLDRGERLAVINEIQGSMNTGIFASPRAFQVMKRATVIARPKTTREEILDDWNKKRDNIFNALDSIEKAGVSSGFTDGIVSGLKAVIAQADGFINFLSVGGKALRTLDQELNAATGGMINLRKGTMAAIGGFALFKGAEFLLRPLFFAIDDIPFRIQQAVTDSLLAFTELQRIKLNLNLASVGNVEQSLDALVARADKLGISFKESAIAYSKFKLLTTDSPLQAQADNIFEGFQEALSARQTNTQQQAESFRAIGQIASKAVVSVEEFTQQLSESGGLNDALNVAARSMGLTTAQFYQQASAGNLLVQDVLPRLAAEYKRMSAGGLSLSTGTLQSEISRFQNNTEQLQMQLGEKIGVVAYPALQALNAGLSTLNDNLGTVASVGAAGLLSVMGFLGKSVMQFAAAGRLGAVASAAMSASLQTAGVASLSTATAMGRLKVSINLATLAGIGLIKALIIPTAVITGIQFVYNALNAGSEELKQAVRTLEESKKALDAWQNKTDNSNRKGLTSFLPDMELSGGEKFFNVITLGIVYNSKWLMSLLELRQGLENIDKSLATGVGNLKEYQKTLSNFSGSKQFSSELQEIRNNLALVRAERTIASAKGNDRSVSKFNQREQDLMKQEQELINKKLGPVGSRITADLQQYEIALASLEQSFKNKDITDIAYKQRKIDLLTIIGQLKKAEQDYLQVLKDQEKEYRKLQVAFDLAIRTRANANFANEGNSLSRSIGLNQQFASGKINEFQFNVKVQEESLQTAKERIATLGNSANSISNTLNERLSKSANKVLSTYFKEDLEQLNVASFGEAIAENLLSPDAIQQIMDQYESDLKDNAALRAILNQAKEYATARRDILNTEREIQQISREIIVERKKRQIQEKQASGEIVKAEQLTNLANKTSSSQNIGYGLEQTKINLAALYNQLALEQEKLVLNVDDSLAVKTAIANITQQIAETELSLRDQQEQIQDYYRNLDRQIIDFNRQIEDYRRQIEDAQLSAFKENRSLSESYSDLVRELDKNLLNAQNQLLDTTDRIRVQQVKNRLLIPGTSDAGKELGDIFLEFVQGQADLASRGRTFQSRTEEIETSYISTLRNIRNLQEQQQEAERNRLRTIEDIKRTQEDLNRTLADLIRQTNKELGFIPQSIKDIVTNLNTLPEPIKLINSELIAISPNIKTSGEDLVKSIEETAEAIRKAKEGLILPAPSNFTPAPVWNGGGFLPPPPSIKNARVNTPGNTPQQMPNVPFASLIEGAARQVGIDPLLFAALVKKESSFHHMDPNNPTQIHKSSAGAMGLSQLMPGTAKELGVNPLNPTENLIGGATYLARMLERFNGNIELAISAYKAGPGNVRNGQLAKGTVKDVAIVMQYYREFLRQFGRNQGGSPTPSISTPSPSPSVQQQITNRLPKNIQSVLVQEVGGETVYSKNAQTPPASPASTIKVIIADLIAKEIASGKLSLKDAIAIKSPLVDPHGQLKANQVRTVEQLIQLMLEKSDNTATNVLIDRLGGLTRATELAKKEGYKNTTISRYLNIPGSGTPNISTAQDVTLAMQSLIKDQNPASQLAEQSLRQTRNFKYNNEIGGKIGNNSKVIGNVGLVNINGKEYIVTAYANINGNQLNNRTIITNATNAISQSIKDSTPNPSPVPIPTSVPVLQPPRVLTKEETKEGKGGPEFSSPPPIAQLPTLPNQNQDNFWDADLPPVPKDNPINFQSPNLPPVPNLPTGNLDAAADQIRNAETANQNAEELLRQLEASFLIDTTLDRAIKFGRQQEEDARALERTLRDASENVADLTINSKGYLTVQEEINKSATEVSRQYRSQIESLEDQRRTLLLNADGWQKMSENIKKVVAEQIALGKMPADVAEQFLKNADALAKRVESAKEQVTILDQAIERLGKNQGVATLEASFRKTRDTVRSIRDRLNDLTIQRLKLENQSRPTLFDDSAILAERISLQKEKEELEDYLEPYKDLPQYADFVANIRSEWEKLAELRLERVALDASPNRGAAESFFSDIREGKGIGSAFSSLGLNIATKFVEGITKPAIDALTSAIDGFTKPITQAFESVFNAIIGPVGNFFTNALNSIFKPVGNIFSSIFGGGGGGGLFNGLLSGITGIFSGGLGGLGSIGSLGSIGASSFASAPASAFSLGTGFSLFSDGGKVGDANVPIEKNIISAFQRERAMSGGRKPRLIVANEDELILNPKETEAYLDYRNNAPIKNYANGGFVGGKPNYSTTSNNNSSNQSLIINNTNNVTVESRNDMGYSLNQLKERENTQNERTKKRFFG